MPDDAVELDLADWAFERRTAVIATIQQRIVNLIPLAFRASFHLLLVLIEESEHYVDQSVSRLFDALGPIDARTIGGNT